MNTCPKCSRDLECGIETDLVKIAKYEVIEAARAYAKVVAASFLSANAVRLASENLLAAVALLESREGKR